MDEVQHGIQQSVIRLVVKELDETTLTGILDEVWRQHEAELYTRALEQVRQEHQQALDEQRERLRDATAHERRQMEAEADRAIEAGIAAGLAEERLDYEEHIVRLRLARDEARSRADLAESLLVHLVRELMGDRRVYLFSGGNGIHQLRLHTLNTVLARHGLIVKGKETTSERQVSCELSPQAWGQRSLFWLDTVTPGVAPEPDEDEDTTAPQEAVQDGR